MRQADGDDDDGGADEAELEREEPNFPDTYGPPSDTCELGFQNKHCEVGVIMRTRTRAKEAFSIFLKGCKNNLLGMCNYVHPERGITSTLRSVRGLSAGGDLRPLIALFSVGAEQRGPLCRRTTVEDLPPF